MFNIFIMNAFRRLIFILDGQLKLVFIDIYYGPKMVVGTMEIKLWKITEYGAGLGQGTFVNISIMNLF